MFNFIFALSLSFIVSSNGHISMLPTEAEDSSVRTQAAGSVPKDIETELDSHRLSSQYLWNETQRWQSLNSTSSLFNINLADIAVASSSTLGVGAYYASWNPFAIDWSGIDWVNYAFALPQADFTLSVSDSEDLKALIDQANFNDKKIFLSIGGWGGSDFFSSAVGPENSPVFIQSILQILNQYPVHGFDFDWEYPNSRATGQDDTANFLNFLQQLKGVLPENVQLSAAVQVWPFADINGVPITDASAFGEVLDKITIMSYDIFTSSSTPGPNAPLSSTCGGVGLYASVVASLETWSIAKFPREKIIMGMAEYGYMSDSSASTLVHRSEIKTKVERQEYTTRDIFSDEGTSSGSITFNSLVRQGALIRISETSFEAGNGWERLWDDCSSTPYLVSIVLERVVSYDDPTSLKLKAEAVRQFGAGGVCSWTLQGDTPEGDLNNALRTGLLLRS